MEFPFHFGGTDHLVGMLNAARPTTPEGPLDYLCILILLDALQEAPGGEGIALQIRLTLEQLAGSGLEERYIRSVLNQLWAGTQGGSVGSRRMEPKICYDSAGWTFEWLPPNGRFLTFTVAQESEELQPLRVSGDARAWSLRPLSVCAAPITSLGLNSTRGPDIVEACDGVQPFVHSCEIRFEDAPWTPDRPWYLPGSVRNLAVEGCYSDMGRFAEDEPGRWYETAPFFTRLIGIDRMESFALKEPVATVSTLHQLAQMLRCTAYSLKVLVIRGPDEEYVAQDDYYQGAPIPARDWLRMIPRTATSVTLVLPQGLGRPHSRCKPFDQVTSLVLGGVGPEWQGGAISRLFPKADVVICPRHDLTRAQEQQVFEIFYRARGFGKRSTQVVSTEQCLVH